MTVNAGLLSKTALSKISPRFAPSARLKFSSSSSRWPAAVLTRGSSLGLDLSRIIHFESLSVLSPLYAMQSSPLNMPALFTVKTHCSVGPGSGITTLGSEEEQPMVWCRWFTFGVAAEMRWCEGGEFFARLGGSLCVGGFFFCAHAKCGARCCWLLWSAARGCRSVLRCVAMRGEAVGQPKSLGEL